MPGEIVHNAETGQILYFSVFQLNGDVFLTGGDSDEVWGTGGRIAADYDEAMTENAPDGHYIGDFPAAISTGVYTVTVYIQAGGSPADSDLADAQGTMYWDGTAEENTATLGDQMDFLSAQKSQVLNRYPTGSQTDG